MFSTDADSDSERTSALPLPDPGCTPNNSESPSGVFLFAFGTYRLRELLMSTAFKSEVL